MRKSKRAYSNPLLNLLIVVYLCGQIYAWGFCVSDQLLLSFYKQSERSDPDRFQDAQSQHVHKNYQKDPGIHVPAEKAAGSLQRCRSGIFRESLSGKRIVPVRGRGDRSAEHGSVHPKRREGCTGRKKRFGEKHAGQAALGSLSGSGEKHLIQRNAI